MYAVKESKLTQVKSKCSIRYKLSEISIYILSGVLHIIIVLINYIFPLHKKIIFHNFYAVALMFYMTVG